MQAVKTVWFALPFDAPLLQQWWKVIETSYEEPHRSYHSKTHLEHIWHLFQTEVNDFEVEASLVLFAACFHDIIYDPKAKDDEERSAKLFEEFAKEAGLATSDVAVVSQLILATIKHEPIPSDSLICCLFLDLDLSILAADWNQYEKYSKGIRFEYLCYDDNKFRMGRSKVLERFLDRDCLYFTPKLREKWELKARQNISRELDLLKH
ncbi:hypothetical protein BDR26DRAFT_849387 [Obelidium mucronatum]|nr:hypothetical protein BDR26DRAFT_849387 [Obelidium mucronatum]